MIRLNDFEIFTYVYNDELESIIMKVTLQTVIYNTVEIV